MKLIVGLGNPGKQYKATRHNVGFEVLTVLSERYFSLAPTKKLDAEISEVTISDEKVLLVAPQTFMNLSGQSVQKIVHYFRVDLENILVVYDDMNLDLGRIRLRASGSAGGQNGLKDILQKLSSQNIPRLRIGIGKPPERFPGKDYVLSRFRPDEVDEMKISIQYAADACELWVKEGIAATMNRYNSTPEGS